MAQADLKEALRAVVKDHGSERVNQTLSDLEDELKDALLRMVQEYGFNQVNDTLMTLGTSESELTNSRQDTAPAAKSAPMRTRRRSMRNTATQYVAKMTLQPETEAAVIELANRFEDKTFLPRFGDISRFCEIYGIDVPASRSRASAIPRVFKFLASMEADNIQRIVDRRSFSGPARLGPIADAIRRNGRAARARSAAVSRAGDNEEI